MPTCFWILVVSSPTCLWWKRGPVGHFLGKRHKEVDNYRLENLQPRTKQHPTDLHKANLFTFTQTNKRQATDQPKSMVEREVHLECLGASVERPV